jgi:hypothetical protein
MKMVSVPAPVATDSIQKLTWAYLRCRVWQLMHSCSGVERGMKSGGKPVEVMGLIMGRCDTESPTTLVVTDVSGGPWTMALPCQVSNSGNDTNKSTAPSGKRSQ